MDYIWWVWKKRGVSVWIVELNQIAKGAGQADNEYGPRLHGWVSAGSLSMGDIQKATLFTVGERGVRDAVPYIIITAIPTNSELSMVIPVLKHICLDQIAERKNGNLAPLSVYEAERGVARCRHSSAKKLGNSSVSGINFFYDLPRICLTLGNDKEYRVESQEGCWQFLQHGLQGNTIHYFRAKSFGYDEHCYL